MRPKHSSCWVQRTSSDHHTFRSVLLSSPLERLIDWRGASSLHSTGSRLAAAAFYCAVLPVNVSALRVSLSPGTMAVSSTPPAPHERTWATASGDNSEETENSEWVSISFPLAPISIANICQQVSHRTQKKKLWHTVPSSAIDFFLFCLVPVDH